MVSAIIHIRDGKITNKETVRNLFNSLNDGRYVVKAEKSNKRSLPQNAFLHGVMIPMVYEGLKDAGFDEVRTHDDAKVIIKELFLKKKVTNGSETFEVTRGTHELNTKEMNDFISDVQRWASEYLGIVIPDPGQALEINF
jgi:hypothetical protein